ncbi:MAG: hypothetical protein JSU98_03955 [Gemmatimonadales bacterium]|jgi:cytochrome b subunit of formate dehydrogenase|nr:MAG: hypothetical protein JSU98_03955 [Gemmatimonadales bacterium]
MKTSSPTGMPLDSAQRGDGPYVWRFNTYHRVTHAVVIVSFFLLTLTGLPLRFSCALWSVPLIRLFGGVEMAGTIHRIAAVMTFGYFGAHLGWLAWLIARAKDKRSLFWGPDSMVPQPRDVVDFVRQIRWYLGRGPRPRFPRFSYMEKFDYFAVFWGVFIIGGSGLLLWFPEFFSRWLPGWVYNVATVIHADEALLASGFIFSIHFFHVHFRPDKFPIDAVMFHGRATREYMEEEHPELADQLPDGGEISRTSRADHFAPPPTRQQTLTAAVLGFAALAVGILCVGGIIWAVSFC